MKELLIIRHAKSSWADSQLRDHDRPLNERGLRNAPEMGQRLVRKGLFPDAVISSSARRARETALTLCRETAFPESMIRFEKSLYLASDDQLLAHIHRFHDNWERVWLVGHNPDLTDLANRLSDYETDNIPTCAVFRVAFDIDCWRDLIPGEGRLIEFDTPKRPSGL